MSNFALNTTQKKRFNQSKAALRRVFYQTVQQFGFKRDGSSLRSLEWFNFNGRGVRIYVDHVESVILESFKSLGVYGLTHEFPLNDAGFKLYVALRRSGSIEVYAHGDQRMSHLATYRMLTQLLSAEGLLPEDFDPDKLT